MITVSLCMIVKNEAPVLRRCLDSLKGIPDEIVIVDTGSDDSTKQIAMEYTDKVFDFKWTGDFSAARNFSISHAAMDYIYIADADEVMTAGGREMFLKLKQTLLPEIDVVQMWYDNQLQYNTTYNFNRELRPKLFKRLRPLYFTDPVHETPQLEPVVYDSGIVIIHLPQTLHAKRDFEIFERLIQTGMSARLSGMYARELMVSGVAEDFTAASCYFEGLAAQEGLSVETLKKYQCVLARAALYSGDEQALMKHSLKNIATGSGSAEVCFCLGEYYFVRQDYREAVIWYYNAAYETEAELNIKYKDVYPFERLAECYEKLGDADNAARYRRCLEVKENADK